MTQEEIKKLLGRELTETEKIIYKLQKDKKEYHFEKDKKGNLISIKN